MPTTNILANFCASHPLLSATVVFGIPLLMIFGGLLVSCIPQKNKPLFNNKLEKITIRPSTTIRILSCLYLLIMACYYDRWLYDPLQVALLAPWIIVTARLICPSAYYIELNPNELLISEFYIKRRFPWSTVRDLSTFIARYFWGRINFGVVIKLTIDASTRTTNSSDGRTRLEELFAGNFGLNTSELLNTLIQYRSLVIEDNNKRHTEF